jgi:AcrR family transcriptional regulator
MPGKSRSRMSGAQRRAAIIAAAQTVFVEKGFYRTTTRELADAAGVSEALLFKHFPSKADLYAAIQTSCVEEEGTRISDWLESLDASTSALVFLVHDLASHLLGGQPDERKRSFIHLVLRSLMDEGEFARLAIQGGPCLWVRKVEQCIEAARAAGDLLEGSTPIPSAAWCAHQLMAGMMLHFLPADPVIHYGVSRAELVKQVIWFCLRGIGMKEEAIRHHYESRGIYDI